MTEGLSWELHRDVSDEVGAIGAVVHVVGTDLATPQCLLNDSLGVTDGVTGDELATFNKESMFGMFSER